jgi:hypothetical protein
MLQRHSIKAAIIALSAGFLMFAGPADARPHGGRHHGGGHHGVRHHGGGHHGGGRHHSGNWHPGGARHFHGGRQGDFRFIGHPIFRHQRYRVVDRYYAPLPYYVWHVRPAPVAGSCSTTRRAYPTGYGWRKIVTTRTCIVP